MKPMDIWNAVAQPPRHALRQIGAGRLKGKTDINPQWRYQALTQQFGPCGIGWKYEITRLWNEPAADGQVFAFATVNLYLFGDQLGKWSDPIPGIGGSMLLKKETRGMHSTDEGYKMAVTDALSVACKALGIAGDIYAGLWDGSKYRDRPASEPKSIPPPNAPPAPPQEPTEAISHYQPTDMSPDERRQVTSSCEAVGVKGATVRQFVAWIAEQKGCSLHDRKILTALETPDDAARWLDDWESTKAATK